MQDSVKPDVLKRKPDRGNLGVKQKWWIWENPGHRAFHVYLGTCEFYFKSKIGNVSFEF